MTSPRKYVYKCPECARPLAEPLVEESSLPTGRDFAGQFLALLAATVVEVVLRISGLSFGWAIAWSVAVFCIVLAALPGLRQLNTFHCSHCHARGNYASLSREQSAQGDA